MAKAYVYTLKSERNGSFYIGSTNNYQRRLDEHERGKSKYTRNNRPYKLVLVQEFQDLKTARVIEYKLKRFANRNVIEKIVLEQKINLEL